MCLLVPVFLGDAIERVKQNGHHDPSVLLKEMQNVFVVPVVQGPLCYLHGRQGRERERENEGTSSIQFKGGKPLAGHKGRQ